MGASLGSLVVSLGLDASEFVRGLTESEYKAKSSAAKLGKELGEGAKKVGIAMGVAAVATAVFVKQSIDAADRINKLSQSTGIAADTLSELAHAGELADVPLDSLATSISRFNKNVSEASQGSGDAKKAFDAMGISVKDNVTGGLKSADALLSEVADRFVNYEDSTEKAALAMALFGKTGAALIPFLNAGSKGIKEMREEARALGLTIDTETGQAAEQFNDNLTRLAGAARGLGNTMMRELLGPLNQITDAFVESAKGGNEAHEVVREFTGFLKGGALVVFQALAVFATEVAFTFKTVGKEIGGIAAQAFAATSAAANFFSGNRAAAAAEWRRVGVIRDEMIKDAESERKKNDAFIDKILRLGEERPAEMRDPFEAWGRNGPWKPGRAPGLTDTNAAAKAAEQFAAAQIALTESRAQRELEILRDTTGHQLAILDSRHERFLVSEQDYWAQRFELIQRQNEREVEIAVAAIGRAESERAEALRKHGARSKEYVEAVKKVEEAESARARLQREYAQQVELGWIKQEQAAQAYERRVQEIKARLLELQGDTAGAARIRATQEFKDDRADAVRRGDSETVANIDKIIAATDAVARFNAEKQKISEINTRLQVEEERIQNSLRAGAISELEAIMRTDEARRAAVVGVEQYVRALEGIASSSGLKELELQAQQARVAMERLAVDSNVLAQKFDKIFADAGADLFNDLISRTKTASEAFRDFGNSVVQQINRMVSEALAKNLFNALFGASGTGAGGAAGGIGGFFAALFKGMGFQAGTSYVPRTGPAILHQGERVIPAAQNRGGDWGPVEVHNSFYLAQPASRQTQAQLSVIAGQSVARAMGRDT